MNGIDQQRRVLGCAGWSLILSIFAAGFFLLHTYVLLNVRRASVAGSVEALFRLDNLVTFLIFWSVIFLIPITIISLVIGSRTQSPASPWRASIIITFLTTCSYTLFVYYIYSSPGFGPDRLIGESFFNPPGLGLSALGGGILLGFVASFGYWHAGRKSH